MSAMTITMAKIGGITVGGTIAITIRIRKKAGIDCRTSMRRIIKMSTQPPKYPAIEPITTPIIVNKNADKTI